MTCMRCSSELVRCKDDEAFECLVCEDDMEWYDAELGWPASVAAIAGELKARRRRDPAAADLAVAIRELRERRNTYAARHAQMVASQAAPEVIDSYAKTLAEVDAAIAAVERLVGR